MEKEFYVVYQNCLSSYIEIEIFIVCSANLKTKQMQMGNRQ